MFNSTIFTSRAASSLSGRLLAVVVFVMSTISLSAQLSLTNGSPSATIDFSNSMQTGVGSNPSTAFAGTGFAPNTTAAGQLNSNAWAVTGWSTSGGNLSYGGTATNPSTAYTRLATTAADPTAAGMYAFTGAPFSNANPVLMIQPTGSNWAPGTITLRVQNNGTTNISQLSISYNIFIRNNAARSNSFNFSHSSDDVTYTSVGSLDYTSPAASDVLGWVLVGGSAPSRSTTITGLSIAPGGFYYIRWSGADAGGTGSRDEFGLDDIAVTATYGGAAAPTQLAITSIAPASPYAGTAFNVTVQSRDALNAPANVVANTDVVISLNTGTGTLGGTLTGTILAGTNSVVITGATYNTAESGVVLTATRTAGDVLTAGNSSAITFLETATNLTISSVNGGGTVFANAGFIVTVTSRNSLNVAAPVLNNTNVSISLNTGTGTLGGTLTGTILAGQSSVTITGLTYNLEETGVVLDVTRTSGDLLTAGSSAAFNVEFGLAVGDISILAYEANDPDKFAFVNWVDIPNGFRIKFTDNGFLSSGSANAANNARGGEEFVIWQNTTGNPILAGTVIQIEGTTASLGTASAGTTGGIAASLANGGDQLFAYFGAATSGANPDWASNAATTTFNGAVVYGLNYGTAPWLTTGPASAGTSYLPSQLNVTNGNIALVDAGGPRGGQYTGTRNGFATFSDYKNAVNNPANWTLNTTATAISINTTAFVLATGSAVTLRITEINNGLNPSANVGFTVQVDALDGLGDLAPVGTNTTVTLSVFTGTGTLAGTFTGTITTGNSSIFIGPMTLDVIENGVVLLATATAGDVLTADQSDAFDVLGGAVTLAFPDIETFLYFNNNIPAFTVEARRSDNSIDLQYNGPVTLSLFSGLGSVTGTLTQIAINGVATFAGIQFSSVGSKVLQASSGALTPGLSPSLTVSFAALTEITTAFPQYMQGVNGTNNNRIPVAFRATLQGLIPNATYRYFNTAVDDTDSDFSNGAGIPIFANAAGFVRASTPSLGTTGAYGEFTTNGSGAYTGWFVLEASGNDRFTPGNEVNMRIMLNDGNGGATTALRLTSSQTITVLNFTGASQGTALRGTSSATARNFVAAFDNTTGTTRPISIAVVESDLLAAQSSYASFYTGSVDGVAGAWGMIIPNNLPNGIRRVEQRRLDNGERIDCGNTDGDGIWPSGANTVNPSSGSTAIHITSTDAPLQSSQPATSITATATSICPGNSVTLTLNGGFLHQGGFWRWYTGGCGATSFNTGTSVVVSPSVTTTYYVRAETSCFQTTCAEITIVVGNCPSNDNRQFAANITPATFGSCNNATGDVTNASSSPEATSTVVTGEDVWYRFTANSPGVRIALTAASFDGVIELQTEAGVTLATENAVSGSGFEALNYYDAMNPLVTGQNYFIAVRNVNSGTGTGTFTLCVQRLRATSCNSGTGPFQMCNTFKATWVGANSYGFTFTNTTTLAQTVVSTTNGVTQVPLGSLLPSFDYNVAISATYNLTDGAGNPEQIVINTPAACTIAMAPHANIELRSTDWCASGPKPLNGFVGANTWLCGAVNYEWRFRQTAPVEDVAFGAPIAGAPTNRFLNLATASLIAGATYDVEVRPIFPGSVPGNWSTTARCLQIIGPASAQQDNDGAQLYRNAEEETISVTLYPNPNNGERVSLSIDNAADLVQVRVLDATGREVNRTVWIATDSTNREIVFGQPLSPGIYVIEMIADGVRSTERMIVQR
jgi:hypothetical protein